MTYGTGSAGNYTGYDQLGRVNVSYQQTASINYGFGYGYNLASEMTSETYPSGRQIITEYDSAGRAAGIRGAAVYYAGATASDATNRIQYAPQGAVSVMRLGNGKWEHTDFNNRLQPKLIGLGTSGTDSSVMKLDYGYGTTSNNGNVTSQIITAPSLTVNQCYGYDYLNRLTSAEEKNGGTACAGTQQWKQAFTYDRFGNRNFDLVNTTSNVLGPNPTISQSTNRIASGQNYGYDLAGNLTSDPATNANGIVYDAENRQTQYTKTGQATNSYYYDGDGHRIKKIDNTGTTVFVYNAGGQLIAEYTAGNPSSGGTSYLTSDHLGSTRVVMKSDGTTTTTTRHDFLPFGEEIQAGIGGRTTGQGYVADGIRQKFTQKERDSESGLDYFGARYYGSAQGRFTGCDPINLTKRHIINPQKWNLYIYVLNNPLALSDPDGRDDRGKGGGKVIDVFLSFAASDRNNMTRKGKTATDSGPDWAKLQANAKKEGYTINIHPLEDTSIKSIKTALATSDVVIVVGHGSDDHYYDRTSGQDPNFVGDGMNVSGGLIRQNGTRQFSAANGEFDPIQPKPEDSAQVTGFFTCKSDGPMSNIFNYTGSGQSVVVNTGGNNGETSVGTLENAAFAFVGTYVDTNGDLDKSVSAAQRRIDKSKISTDQDGDKIKACVPY